MSTEENTLLVKRLIGKQRLASPQIKDSVLQMLGLMETAIKRSAPVSPPRVRGVTMHCIKHNTPKYQQASGRWRCRRCRVEEVAKRAGR